MSVSLYFGLPGCGKTTLLTAKALQAVKKGRYRNVYCNVHIKVFGVTYIDNSCIGKYDLSDCLILIDEATLYADSREHRNFSMQQVTYFLEHRHFNADILLFTQQWDGVDKKIRVITDRVYYVYKGIFLGKWFTRYYRIPYGIIIPSKKDNTEKLGDIVQGYCKPNIIVRLLSPWLFRPTYYPYFDSWDKPDGFLPLPQRYKPYYEVIGDQIVTSAGQKRQLHKSSILLRLESWIRRLPSPSFLKKEKIFDGVSHQGSGNFQQVSKANGSENFTEIK